jgi:methylglutaconyl-CoA hydratase
MSPDLESWGDLAATTVDRDADGVLWITLQRPQAANSRNQTMRNELARIYRSIAADSSVRVVVLTGAGDRFFCAGMDLKEAAEPEAINDRRDRMHSSRDIEMLAALPMPTIAAINGYALGGGCEMALACDIRVMADSSKIGLTEVVHGLVPGGGGTQRLPKLVGVSRAFSMIYLAEQVSGTRAAEIGLAHASVPSEHLMETVGLMAKEIAGRSPRAMKAAKKLLLRSMEVPVSAGVDLELDTLIFLLEAQAQERDDAASSEK